MTSFKPWNLVESVKNVGVNGEAKRTKNGEALNLNSTLVPYSLSQWTLKKKKFELYFPY